MKYRIGHGFDAHQFGPGDHVMLGGMRIPHVQGVVAHSDGDVLIHALCDALLGAAGLGDIGQHFPDSDPQFRGADSRKLLQEVAAKLKVLGYSVANVDLTLLAEQPRIGQYVSRMQQTLVQTLDLEAGQVSVKATTLEGMGWVGRGEGLAAHAVVLIEAR